MTAPKYPAVSVQLTGRDGNALSIIGAVARALRGAERDGAVPAGAAAKWTAAAWASGSYDGLLRLALTWVDVS